MASNFFLLGSASLPSQQEQNAMMPMRDLLLQNRPALQQRCFDLIVASYPADSQGFFQNQKNRFLNPLGAAISNQVEKLFDHLLQEGDDPEDVSPFDDFIDIRAVQEFTPSQAVGFVLCLKQAIREGLAEQINTEGLFTELLVLETKVDRLLLHAFDAYMKSREKIYEIRANALKRQSYLAIRQASSE